MGETELAGLLAIAFELGAESGALTECGDPPEGSRLWRCERELANARATIAEFEANEGRCGYSRWQFGDEQPSGRCELARGHEGPHQVQRPQGRLA